MGKKEFEKKYEEMLANGQLEVSSKYTRENIKTVKCDACESGKLLAWLNKADANEQIAIDEMLKGECRFVCSEISGETDIPRAFEAMLSGAVKASVKRVAFRAIGCEISPFDLKEIFGIIRRSYSDDTEILYSIDGDEELRSRIMVLY